MQEFIQYLIRLNARDRGALAILRRSVGFAPGGYPPAYPYVERFVGRERHEQAPFRLALYVTAGLFAIYPLVDANSLASRLGDVARRQEGGGVERRFIALLSADSGNVAQYLRQAITLLTSSNVGVDYGKLCQDLTVWLDPRNPDRHDDIRRRWARDFYRAIEEVPQDDQEMQPTTL